MGTSIYFWIGFHVFVFIMLALDLGVFHKNTHKVPVKEAIMWSSMWISLAMLFALFIYLDKDFGKIRALEFLTGYVIEYSLSVDNIFVFILIFSYFSVNSQYQHKILFWGILGELLIINALVYIPGLNKVFNHYPLPGKYWLIEIAFIPSVLIFEEIRKLILRKMRKPLTVV